jgi:hypothetical protein
MPRSRTLRGVTDAVGLITGRVRDRVRGEGLDLGASAARAVDVVREEVSRYSERALGGVSERDSARQRCPDCGLVRIYAVTSSTGSTMP